MSKKELENKRELARMLYMNGSDATEITDKVAVSRQSVSAWISKGGWKQLRAAHNITRPELVNKLLLAINNLIENVNESDDPAAVGGLADKLSKLSVVIEKLDKKANVVQAIDVFMAFSKWSPSARRRRRTPAPRPRPGRDSPRHSFRRRRR